MSSAQRAPETTLATTQFTAPYPGLRPFRLEDAPLFFGREKQVAEMLERLESNRFLAVVGTSGSGKSSLVQAGLLPALRGGMLFDAPPHWRFVVARPGDAPFDSLARQWCQIFRPMSEPPDDADIERFQVDIEFTTAQLRSGLQGLVNAFQNEDTSAGTASLVLIDQFEELFRFRGGIPGKAGEHHEQRNTAATFVNLLLATARQTEVPLYVVITMRSEFIGACDAFLGLPESISRSQYLTPRMSRPQLEQAITGPLSVWEPAVAATPELVARLLNDVGTDPDQLPLMQHALLRTWQQAECERGARGNDDDVLHLTLDDYTAVGGMSKALCNHADQAVAELLELPPDKVLDVETETIRQGLTSDQQRDRLRMIEMLFRSLCEQKDEGPLVRRVVSVADVLAILYEKPGQHEFEDLVVVIEAFRAEGRNFLVTTPAGEITRETKLDISHEALLRQWTRLSQEWVPREIEAARQFRHYAEEARRYHADQGELLVGASLKVALDWWNEQQPSAGWIHRYVADPCLLREFIADSRQEDARLLMKQATWRRFRIGLFAVVCISLIAALIAAILAIRSELKAAREKHKAERFLAESCLLNGGTAARYEHEIARALAWYGQAYLTSEKGSDAHESARRLISSWSVSLGRPLLHDGHVFTVSFSPDGRTLATASEDNTARLWDTATGQPRVELRHEGRVFDVSFSPDGRTLATASEDNTARLWDTATGQPRVELRHEGRVFDVSFSPDGRTLATASEDNTARLWDTATGQPRGEPLKHEDEVRSVSFSPDGRTLATASEDNTARLWDATTGQPRGEPLKHDGRLSAAVSFSPDGRTLATASDGISRWSGDDNTARRGGGITAQLWDTSTGQLRGEPLNHGGTVSAVSFSPDGRTLATASYDSTARLWDTSTCQLRAELIHDGPVSSVSFSPDGCTLATGSEDHTARLWHTATGQPRGELLTHEGIVVAVAFSSDGRMLATASEDNTARLWDTATRQPRGERLTHEEIVVAVAFSPDGHMLATASEDNTARLWDTATGQPRGKPLKHDGEVSAVSFSSDGRTLATASEDNTARLWDTATGQPRGEPLKHEDEVRSVSFSPDGRTLATAGYGITARLWDTATRQPRGEPLTHEGFVCAVAFSLDGRTLATAMHDRTARLWDTATRQPRGELLTHEGIVVAVAFSPDGRTLATASYDNMARLWDTATGQPRGEPLTHEGFVCAVAFSPDGHTLATASYDNTARLWDTATRQPRGEPLTHEGIVAAVAFSPDGRTLATASDDTARLWDIPPPVADPNDPKERLWLSIQYRTTLTIEDGVVRRLKQAEWLECWRRLEELGGPNDVRSWDQVSPRERTLLKRP